MSNTISAIGHSTRPIDDFINLLRQNGVELLADIPTIPKSRRNPQCWHDAFAASLAGACPGDVALPGLGKRRRAAKDSINVAWRNASFQGYADHRQTDEFAEALAELIALSREHVTVIMCAEAVP